MSSAAMIGIAIGQPYAVTNDPAAHFHAAISRLKAPKHIQIKERI